jgi:hypothetical protein
MKSNPFVCRSMASLSLSFAMGCGDPGAPAVSGTLSLGTSVHSSDFSSLQIRAYPDGATIFDASRVAADPIDSATDMLTSVAFPFRYQVGGGIGTSEARSWRVVAWLSHMNLADKLASGDVFCTTLFTLHSCGAYGGYCGETRDVDCALALTVP